MSKVSFDHGRLDCGQLSKVQQRIGKIKLSDVEAEYFNSPSGGLRQFVLTHIPTGVRVTSVNFSSDFSSVLAELVHQLQLDSSKERPRESADAKEGLSGTLALEPALADREV